ncbi:MAG: pilus assembly protein N-terminal domain-containing protein [Alphaproteobacteria bacterium]|nr:pilus assembly protein N-terminal domain-containing protein [Alphaproteobacteria bacterium]
MKIGNANSAAISLIMVAFLSLLLSYLPVSAGGLDVSGSISAETLVVNIDEAKLVRLSSPAKSIVIGNPMIADAIAQSPQTLIVTGKSNGRTNLIIMDAENHEISRYNINVRVSQSFRITVYKGPLQRQSLSCSPQCNPVPMPGDSTEYMDKVIRGITNRNKAIQSSSSSSF